MSTITKNTIIFGGAFNPPTIAHEEILSKCIDYSLANNCDIWILPSGNRLDKTIDVSREKRIAYIKAMIQDVDTKNVVVEICQDELNRNKSTNTYDTVKEFNSKYTDRRFIWLFGSDSIATMRTWPGGDWLAENLKVIITERDDITYNKTGIDCVIFKIKIANVSSTMAREEIVKGRKPTGLVGPEVLAIL